ncbi:MAG: Flp pilus assembly complex ATPase component TadA [Phycisphaerae bacterium]|nr:Flp pilus assembly complex ATPase component TadA [Phycisphaerae bacterium]
MANKRRHLGEILYKAGKVEKAALIEAIKATKTTKKRLGEILLERGLVDEEVLHKAIAKQFGLKYVNLDTISVPADVASLIPVDLVRRYGIVPLKRQNGTLKLAISDPMDLEMMDTVRMQAGAELECYIASPSKIRTFLEEDVEEEDTQEEDDQLKHSIDATAAELEQLGDFQAEILKASGADATDDGPVVRLVNLVIDNAYYMRASDIHIEPMADRVRVRYRVDGVCVEKDNIPKSMQPALMTRFKILSGMDIAEKRIPQDGRIKRRIGDADIDFRVSALPANHGESVVLRILRPDAVNIGIEALGFAPDNQDMFDRIIKRPNGIFLVTGPTGSGKTTTLYAALQTLNRPDKKILTAEDPVEYNFAGMNQCQVRADIGLTFDKILRAMLRQAPNIILVGEIRDGEVADIAIQAALTGHLVFSTLHTNDACSAITRLIDMGVKPFLVASSIQAILAQRLVRVICKNCKAEDPNPDQHALKILKISPEDIKKKTFYKGKGCSKCSGTGYKGRQGIFEMIEMNTKMRELAFREATATELRRVAVASGMRTLMEDGKLKIFGGVTTPEEVARIAQSEGVVED